MHATVLKLEIVVSEIHGEPVIELIATAQRLGNPVIHGPVCEVMAVLEVLVEEEFVGKIVFGYDRRVHSYFMLCRHCVGTEEQYGGDKQFQIQSFHRKTYIKRDKNSD